MRSVPGLLVLTLIVGIAACGGSESTCAPSGSWAITDTKASTSGGVCASLPASSAGTIQLSVDSAAKTFTWTESGVQFGGTIDLGTCRGTVTTTLNAPTADPTITVTTTGIRTAN